MNKYVKYAALVATTTAFGATALCDDRQQPHIEQDRINTEPLPQPVVTTTSTGHRSALLVDRTHSRRTGTDAASPAGVGVARSG